MEIVYKLKSNKAAMWWISYAAKWLVVILAVTAWSLAMVRVGQKKALAVYEGWLEDYKIERMEIDRRNADADPAALRLNTQSEELARVLYGVKDNDSDDLRTMCWCVFNRTDNPSFPSTLEEVIAQPSQWMRYEPDNPVLEPLYQIAREELTAWQEGGHRPCANNLVYMTWSEDDICLRDTWMVGNTTRYWRYGQ